jgi:peroxiredoxin (alkyl hydroperoxide reductase subunit C)
MSDPAYPPPPARNDPPFPKIGDLAPDFTARTTMGPLTLSDLRGRWVVLFAHPADFTPVCTSEFISLSREIARFEAMDCVLLGLSVDSLPAHLAWVEAVRARFGVTIAFPIIEDASMAIAQAYGMLDAEAENSATVRAVHVIDPEGVIRALTWYPAQVGRSVPELLRLVAALQAVAAQPVFTPESWMPGGEFLLPPPETQAEVETIGPSWFLRFAGKSANWAPCAGPGIIAARRESRTTVYSLTDEHETCRIRSVLGLLAPGSLPSQDRGWPVVPGRNTPAPSTGSQTGAQFARVKPPFARSSH